MPWTLVMHSGLGPTAVEAVMTSPRPSQEALQEAGAVVVDRYEHACALEQAALVYRSESAIAPSGVRGRFHPTLKAGGLPVLVADEQLATAARLLADGLAADDATAAARQLCP